MYHVTLMYANSDRTVVSPHADGNWLEELEVRPGMTLSLMHFKSEDDIVIEFELDRPQLVFGCFLTGKADSTLRHRAQPAMDITTHSGYCGVAYLPELRGANRYPADMSVAAVHLCVEASALHNIEPEVYKALPRDLRNAIEKNDGPFCRTATMTPPIQQAVNQILSFPCSHLTRRMYQTSKAMELISLMLDHCVFPARTLSAPRTLSPADIKRIHAAREYLLAHMQDPPSLLQLARHVGVNDFKLKKGFRQLYGNSVFGCLREHRMAHARHMLEDGNRSIKEISYAVGYKNAHSFSDAFMQYYGVRPSLYGM